MPGAPTPATLASPAGKSSWLLLRDCLLTALRRPTLWVWFVYPLAAPFYPFHSGQPQPADLLLLVAAVTTFFAVELRSAITVTPTTALVAFVGWAALVNTVWAFVQSGIAPEEPTTISSIFLAFNLVVFITFLAAYARHRHVFLAVFASSTALSLFIQFVFANLVETSPTEPRLRLFFNNPNQLGYFAVLAATVVILAGLSLRMPVWFLAIALSASAWLATLSVSRAALASIAILAALAVVRRLAGFLVVAVLAAGLFLWMGREAQIAEFADRVTLRTSPESNGPLEDRGYDRIFNHPSYLLLGAGEGNYDRFDSALRGELHSTWGNIVFSYGVPGTLLFGVFLLRLTSRSGSRILLLAPIFVYGLAHQGLRFRYFWLTLAFFFCLLGDPVLGYSRWKSRVLRPFGRNRRRRQPQPSMHPNPRVRGASAPRV